MGCCGGGGKKRSKGSKGSGALSGSLGGGVRLGESRFWAAAHNAAIVASESMYAIPCGFTLAGLLATGDLDRKSQMLEFLVLDVPTEIPKQFVVGRAPVSVDGEVRWFEWRWKKRKRLTVWFRVLRRGVGAWYYFSGGPKKTGGVVTISDPDFKLETVDFGWCSFLVLRDKKH